MAHFQGKTRLSGALLTSFSSKRRRVTRHAITEYSVRYVHHTHDCERTRRLPGGEDRMLPTVTPQRSRRVVRRLGSRDFARRRRRM